MKHIRTGSLGLDILMKGGWERGHIHEIWGEPGSGKTTLAEHAIWELDEGEKAVWMSLGRELPHRPTGALLAQPRNAEQAFTIMETMLIGDVSLIVVDSANGLIRQAELDGDPDYRPHPQREYKDELNGLKKVCRDNHGTVIFISKPRDRDREPIRGTGISEKARSRVHLRIDHLHQDETRDLSAWLASRPDDVVTFRMKPGTGIDWPLELAQLAVHYGVAEQRGSWIVSGSNRYQGIQEYAHAIDMDSRLAVQLDDLVRYAGMRARSEAS